jgi:hypothetical protein
LLKEKERSLRFNETFAGLGCETTEYVDKEGDDVTFSDKTQAGLLYLMN